MRGSFTIGRIMGIQIEVNSSWFLIFGLVTYMLATSYFPQAYPGWTSATDWILGGIIALMLFASVLLHELSHSLVSTMLGIPVRRITLFIFGGIAQIGGEPDEPGTELKMAIAGPAMSVLLFIVLLLLAKALGFLGSSSAVVVALTYTAQVNLILAIFNLVPAYPLDGGRVLRAILWYWRGDMLGATRIASSLGNMFGYFLILVGLYWALTGDYINGIWFVFIGWYIHRISQSNY